MNAYLSALDVLEEVCVVGCHARSSAVPYRIRGRFEHFCKVVLPETTVIESRRSKFAPKCFGQHLAYGDLMEKVPDPGEAVIP